MSRPQEFKNRPGNVAKVVTFDSTQQQVAVYEASDPNEVRPPIGGDLASIDRRSAIVAPTNPAARAAPRPARRPTPNPNNPNPRNPTPPKPPSVIPQGKTGDPVKDLEAKLNYITEAVPLAGNIVAGSTAGAGSGAFCHLTPVPIRPRRRGERDPLRTFSPGVSLRPSRVPRFQSRRTHLDAFQLRF
jgi:hypothetical protein